MASSSSSFFTQTGDLETKETGFSEKRGKECLEYSMVAVAQGTIDLWAGDPGDGAGGWPGVAQGYGEDVRIQPLEKSHFYLLSTGP